VLIHCGVYGKPRENPDPVRAGMGQPVLTRILRPEKGKVGENQARDSLLLCHGSAMWSDRFCRGPLPVLAAWDQKPSCASMARRPLRTSFCRVRSLSRPRGSKGTNPSSPVCTKRDVYDQRESNSFIKSDGDTVGLAVCGRSEGPGGRRAQTRAVRSAYRQWYHGLFYHPAQVV
jgi:hypothetical protein